MARLKSRQESPPFGFLFVEPRIPQWKSPTGSFDAVVRAVIMLRQGNRGLTSQHSLSMDYEVVANEVDEQNAQRCLAHGWHNFVMDSVGPAPPVFRTPQRLRAAGVAAAVKRPLIGVAIVQDWLGDGLKPVEPELSAKRAAVCVKCPQNGDPNFMERLTGAAAEALRSLMIIRDDLSAKTPFDDQLHQCKICSCNLRLKVHTPIEHIAKHTPPDQAAALAGVTIDKDGAPMQCWLIGEMAANR